MKKALLHIGTGKTGTTTIQRSCTHSASLSHNKITYPLLPGFKGQNNQNYLAIIYKPFEKLPRQYKSRYKGSHDNYLQELETLKKNYYAILEQAENLFISAEYLTNFSLDEIDKLLLDLAAYGFKEFKVLIYVRDPVSYYISNLQQRIKASHLIENPKTFKYHFKKYIETWSQKSPKGIKVLPYDRRIHEGSGLLGEVEKELKEFFDLKRVRLRPVSRQNASLSIEALIVLREFRKLNHQSSNNIFSKDSDLLRKLLTNLQLEFSSAIRLHEKYEETITANHLDDLIWLKNRFRVKFEGFQESTLPENMRYGSTDPSQLFRSYDIDKIFKVYSQVLEYLLKLEAPSVLAQLTKNRG